MGVSAQQWRFRLLAKALQDGAVIAYPTEAVWGLGCLPAHEAAVNRLLALKKRPWQKGLILIASRIEQIMPYIKPLEPGALEELQLNWPGPITYLLPASEKTPYWIRGKHEKVAIRVTAHPLCRAICDELGQPIVSTSANPAGKPPAKSLIRLRQYFGDSLDHIVPGDLGGNVSPSEIRDLITGEVIRGAT